MYLKSEYILLYNNDYIGDMGMKNMGNNYENQKIFWIATNGGF